ncbi:MAG TPA: hypothetical protein VNT54_15285, partial [Solirubrobacteraceae bacterium]|nr:hypothetical protein [Solirubrobacteraceae bacterium]
MRAASAATAARSASARCALALMRLLRSAPAGTAVASTTAPAALEENLQAAYRNGTPDIVSVIVSAEGFTDLLEKAEFLKRIAE